MRGSAIDREIKRGLDRAITRVDAGPGWFGRLGTERMVRAAKRRHPEIVPQSLRELALMRAGWQRISYRRALRQLIDRMREGSEA